MNINIHKANERRFAEIMDTTLNTTRTVWEIMTLKTLHDDFGFGEKRLMQFADALRENYGGFNREMSLTDTYKNRTASNLDAALIRAVRDLRHDSNRNKQRSVVLLDQNGYTRVRALASRITLAESV